MHSKHCIINNLQGRYLRSPSDCELTQDSDRKNAHNLGSITYNTKVLSAPTLGSLSPPCLEWLNPGTSTAPLPRTAPSKYSSNAGLVIRVSVSTETEVS